MQSVVGSRFHTGMASMPRVRRATDVVLLVLSLACLLGLIAAYPPGPLERAFTRFVAAFPGWLDVVWGFSLGVVGLWTVAMIVVPLALRRPRVSVEAVLSIVVCLMMAVVVARLGTGRWPSAEEAGGISDRLAFPDVRLGIAAAVITVANAHIARASRDIGRWVIVLGFVGAVMVGSSGPTALLAAVLIGLASGAIVRLALGTSAGLPTAAEVAATLGELGVHVADLEPLGPPVAGIYVMTGRMESGDPVEIKVYGRDAYDNQLVSTVWRRLWYRDGGGIAAGLHRGYTGEHEAFLILLADASGAPATRVLTAGTTPSGDSILAVRAPGRRLADLPPGEAGRAFLEDGWRAVGRLAAAGIYHGRIDPWTVRVSDGRVVLSDFAAGGLSRASARSLMDQAQWLVTTAIAAGIESAADAAVSALGHDRINRLLSYLQPAALGGSLRVAARNAGVDVDQLRSAVATRAEVEPPEPVRLRRVSRSDAVQLGLLVFAAGAILSFLSGIDFGELVAEIRQASWEWMAVGLVVAQSPRLTQALSTRGSVPVDVPFGPVYVLQLATGYLNLAVPSGIGRIAVNIRFFQLNGVEPPVAVTAGAIDSVMGTVMQVALLLSVLVFSEATLTLDFTLPSTPGIEHVLAFLVAVGILVLLLLTLRIGRAPRARMRAAVGRWLPQIRSGFASLRQTRKLTQLVLGNLGTELLFAATVGVFARALGYPLSLAEVLVINLGVALFASLIPVPGGIGIAEGGLAVGLASAGLPDSSAFAVAIAVRISTFYLPPTWGWFALRWLRRNRYL
jgi:uncharacterized membrane protein YbhN (UPF0104 family)